MLQDMPVGFSPRSFPLYIQLTMTVVWHQLPVDLNINANKLT